jgi:hypothetical protein
MASNWAETSHLVRVDILNQNPSQSHKIRFQRTKNKEFVALHTLLTPSPIPNPSQSILAQLPKIFKIDSE